MKRWSFDTQEGTKKTTPSDSVRYDSNPQQVITLIHLLSSCSKPFPFSIFFSLLFIPWIVQFFSQVHNSSCYFYHVHHIPCTVSLARTKFRFYFSFRMRESIFNNPCALSHLEHKTAAQATNKRTKAAAAAKKKIHPNGEEFYSIFIFIFMTVFNECFAIFSAMI